MDNYFVIIHWLFYKVYFPRNFVTAGQDCQVSTSDLDAVPSNDISIKSV